MTVWTLEVIKRHEIPADPVTHEDRFTEETILAGVFNSKQAAMASWKLSFQEDWDDFDLTEWDVCQ